MKLVKQNNDRIFGLDLVRTIAILWVVFSHIHYLIDSVNPTLISFSGLFGYSGVELFFVLSGFLIGSILLKLFVKEDFKFSNLFVFLKRRWFRTLPNYYLILIINLLVAAFLSYPMDEWWNYFFFLQNFSNYKITFFNESWSLSVEEWAYILTPFALLIASKLFLKNKKYGFLITTILMIIVFHFIRFLFQKNNTLSDMNQWNTDLKSVVIYRIDSILFGFVIAWIHYYFTDVLKKYAVYLFIISLHLFVLQFSVLNAFNFELNATPIYFDVFYFSLSSLTFALALPVFIYWEKANNWLSKPVTFMSKISYSIYLLHYSIISVLIKYFLSSFEITLPSFMLIFIYLVLTILFSYFLYRFYEKPMMDLRDKK
jgi:peptidoglycan/LPS O-acetylase OafA/YrhL